jgi:LysR family nitrogen assimilation transcriptional regulator
MELKQLSAVVTVAETGSVTRAALVLHLVQPAVTRQIRALEHELGVALFERSHQGMRPTPACELLLIRARRVLGEIERTRAEVRPDPGILHGIVTVGLLESMTDLVAEPLVSTVSAAHPGIKLRLLTAYSGYLQHWVDDGDLDLTLLYNLKGTHGLNVRPIARELLWAVAPTDAGLVGEEPVDMALVAEQPLVLPGAGHGLRVLIDQAASRAGVTPTIAIETNSMRVQKQLVVAGHGWTILPGIGVSDDVAAGLLSGASLSDHAAYRDVVVALPRNVGRKPAVAAVATIMIQQMRTAVDDGRWPSATWQGDEDS